MTISNERGSALIITLMLLLILTAIGIYAISISTTEMSVALQSKTGTATLNAADSGANYGIDQVPNILYDDVFLSVCRWVELQRATPATNGCLDDQARVRCKLPLYKLPGDEHRDAPSAVRRSTDSAGHCRLRAGSRGDDVLNVVSPWQAKGESR